MKNIPYTTDDVSLTRRLADILHTPQFECYAISPGFPINFKVHLFQDKYHRNPHSGSGTLTLHSAEIGQALLQVYGFIGIDLEGRFICLRQSKNQPRSHVLEEVRLLPYHDPLAIREKEERLADLSRQVELQSVQFAWLCRDQTLSIEWQWDSDDESFWNNDDEIFLSTVPTYHLYFHEDTRQVMVERSSYFTATSIGMRYSRIQAVETDSDAKSISLWLEVPPSFEEEEEAPGAALVAESAPRRKLKYLNATHEPVAPFASKVLRLVCQSLTGLAEFKRMAGLANLTVNDHRRPAEQRRLFSEGNLKILEEWLGGLDWYVAFQCEALHRNLLLDTAELLNLRSRINELVRSRGPQHTTQVIRQFGLYLRELWSGEVDVDSFFTMAMKVTDQNGTEIQGPNTDPRIVQCLHITFTPTSMILRDPFPDTSNRILRQYPKNQDAFLRVSFTDEDRLKFEFDRRGVDGPGFIQDHVGTILKKGFQLCGRQ